MGKLRTKRAQGLLVMLHAATATPRTGPWAAWVAGRAPGIPLRTLGGPPLLSPDDSSWSRTLGAPEEQEP